MENRVYLYAYDKTNLGDDLFIETIVNRYPDTLFYMMSDMQNKKKFKRVNNLKVIDKNSWVVLLLKKIRPSLVARYEAFYKSRCDAHVYIGGSIFMEYPTWKNIVNWWKYQAEHYNFYVLGANFGPYKTAEYKDEMKEVFVKLKDVCFRDRYSYELFSCVESVCYAPDILFGYNNMPKATQIKKQVFMSLIDCNSKEDEKLKQNSKHYILKMTELADSYLKDGYKIVFVSFCKEENDMIAIQSVCENLSGWKENTHYSVIEYDGYNAQQILLEMGQSEVIIASRFHAMILGFLTERPVLPVIYSNKTKNVLEDMNYQGNIIDIRKLDNINYDCWDYFNLDVNKIDITKMKTESEKHFYKLDKLLND